MKRTLFTFLVGCMSLGSTGTHAAQEILLRLQPTLEAPVVAKVIASDKVIQDTAPAPKNAELGWRKISLPSPFEGYVDITALGKNFAIPEGTPVHYLPTVESGKITLVEEGDLYEVVSVTEDWATLRYRKDIIGYFTDEPSSELQIESSQQPLVATPPASLRAPDPIAIPARPIQINADQPIAQLDPDSLPPENVAWQPVVSSGDFSRHPQITAAEAAATPTSRISNPASRISNPIMVTPAQTQAREATPDLGPAKAPRLLTGQLVREINIAGPGYPIRLKSPEGRLIAYVDFSGIYLSDLSVYIDQKVYIRGQIYPLPEVPSQLVILAEDIQIAE